MREIGYWGVPGLTGRTKTHVVTNARGGVNLCGVPVNPKAEFQFCAPVSRLKALECDRCKREFQRESLAIDTGRKP